MPERIYRDSVHNIIRIETGTAAGDLLVSLVDTPELHLREGTIATELVRSSLATE